MILRCIIIGYPSQNRDQQNKNFIVYNLILIDVKKIHRIYHTQIRPTNDKKWQLKFSATFHITV